VQTGCDSISIDCWCIISKNNIKINKKYNSIEEYVLKNLFDDIFKEINENII
jgi:hypothetical protein